MHVFALAKKPIHPPISDSGMPENWQPRTQNEVWSTKKLAAVLHHTGYWKPFKFIYGTRGVSLDRRAYVNINFTLQQSSLNATKMCETIVMTAKHKLT